MKRSAKTSKVMLPCGRGALLAKSAGFKKTPEDKRRIRESYTKNDPINNKEIKLHTKMIRDIFNKKKTSKIQPTFRSGSPMLEPFAWLFPGAAHYFLTWFLEPSRGTPNGNLGYQKGTKGCQKELKIIQAGGKMMLNNIPTHNQSGLLL